jgi:purine nucleosidase
MRRFLIDTDTGSDDAVALVLALRHPDVRVEAITVVSGNVGLEQATQNALYTVEMCGASVPVYRGLAKPIMRPLENAEEVHGGDGMGDLGLPLSGRVPAEGHAVDRIIALAREYPGELTLVTLGPLSNIAAALLRAPELAQLIPLCVMMGGTGDGHGNVSPVAEYNIWADPEAARIVFESGMAIQMVGWDISRKYAVFNPADVAAIKALNTPLAHFAADIQVKVAAFALAVTRLEGFDLPDPITMAVALDPSLIRVSKQRFVTVETGDGLCRGQTVVDELDHYRRPRNTEVVLDVSREGFLKMLHTALS